MKPVRALATALIAAALPLTAAQAEETWYDTIEAAARVDARSVSRLQRDTVARFGELLRFEVRLDWRNAEQRPDTEAPIRIVRYLARCTDRQMALAAVAVFDNSGRLVKSFGVPPGAWEYTQPAAGSAEVQWLETACRMPV